jgi:FixJ family two-component response regulator
MGESARTIAVIDDDLGVLESLVNLLASCGHTAEGYCSAGRFLSVDALSKSACIVTDVEMPAMTGLGLLHYGRSVNSPVQS